MVYKLKKQLTAEELVDTKWVVNDDDKQTTIFKLANKFSLHIYFGITYKVNPSENIHYYLIGNEINVNLSIKHKEMNFDEWFEEELESSTMCTEVEYRERYSGEDNYNATIITNDKEICKRLMDNPDLKLKVIIAE